MSKIKEFIDFTGITEAVNVAIRELFPNFGKSEHIMIYVKNDKYPKFHKNNLR